MNTVTVFSHGDVSRKFDAWGSIFVTVARLGFMGEDDLHYDTVNKKFVHVAHFAYDNWHGDDNRLDVHTPE